MMAKKKSKEQPRESRRRRLPHGLEDETFSIKEAAAIADIADKTVRNEIYVDLFRVELDDKSRVALRGLGAREVALHVLAIAAVLGDAPVKPLLAAGGVPGGG